MASICSMEELQIFLGMAGFYRKYVNGYAKISVPMTDQLLEGAEITFHWGEEQQRSFDKLKVALATAPISNCRSAKTICG